SASIHGILRALRRGMRRLVVAGLALLVGCWLEVWNARGEAAVRWRIQERVDAAACAAHAIDQVEVRVIDAPGDTKASVTAPCADFIATARVDPGWYTAEVTARGTGATRRTEAFHVPYHGAGGASVDFPASAFATPL